MHQEHSGPKIRILLARLYSWLEAKGKNKINCTNISFALMVAAVFVAIYATVPRYTTQAAAAKSGSPLYTFSGSSAHVSLSPHLPVSAPLSNPGCATKRRFTMSNAKEVITTHANGTDFELKVIDINSISIPEYHPRHDLGDLEDLIGSMRRDGLNDPPYIRETDSGGLECIDGARRITGCKEMGIQQIPCIVRKGISEAEAAHLSYLKNVKRKSLSAVEIAQHIQRMIDTYGYTYEDLDLLGYGSKTAISKILKLRDLPEKIKKLIQSGDLTASHGYELVRLPRKDMQTRMAQKIIDHDLTVRRTEERVSNFLSKKKRSQKERPESIIPSREIPGVYFKDARSMDEIPDKCVHLIVTSPPYYVGMEFEVGMTFKEHLANIRDVMKECARVLVPGGIMAINVADIMASNTKDGAPKEVTFMGHRYQSYLKKYGVFLEDIIMWVKRPAWRNYRYDRFKEGTVHTTYTTYDNWEPVYIYRKKGEREIPPEEIVLQSELTREQWIGYIDGVWKIEPNRNSHRGHPCTYPDELVNRLVRLFSYVGDSVLDPFLGSGTTIQVARELGREGIGYERLAQYKEVIARKLGFGETSAPAKSMVEYADQSANVEDRDAEKTAAEAAAFDRMMEESAESSPAV